MGEKQSKEKELATLKSEVVELERKSTAELNKKEEENKVLQDLIKCLEEKVQVLEKQIANIKSEKEVLETKFITELEKKRKENPMLRGESPNPRKYKQPTSKGKTIKRKRASN